MKGMQNPSARSRLADEFLYDDGLIFMGAQYENFFMSTFCRLKFFEVPLRFVENFVDACLINEEMWG